MARGIKTDTVGSANLVLTFPNGTELKLPVQSSDANDPNAVEAVHKLTGINWGQWASGGNITVDTEIAPYAVQDNDLEVVPVTRLGTFQVTGIPAPDPGNQPPTAALTTGFTLGNVANTATELEIQVTYSDPA